MTTADEEHGSNGDRIGDLLSCWLDAGQEPNLPDDLTLPEQQHVADLCLLNALLEQVSASRQEATREALANVLRLVRNETEGLPLPAEHVPPEPLATRAAGAAGATDAKREHPRRNWFSSLAAAAVVLAVLGVWRLSRPTTAWGLVEQARRAAEEEVDRTYRVQIANSRWGGLPREGALHVRGGNRFVYSHSGPLGGTFLIGCNGGEYWFVPPLGPALIHNQRGILAQWLRTAESDLPFLKLTWLLERLGNDYLMMASKPAPANPGGPLLQRLTARLSNPEQSPDWMPATIDAWIDRPAGTLQKVTLEFAPSGHSPESLLSITLTLADSQPHVDRFYTLDEHLGPRSVVDLRRGE